jgi:hypothetical protein
VSVIMSKLISPTFVLKTLAFNKSWVVPFVLKKEMREELSSRLNKKSVYQEMVLIFNFN